MTICAQKEHGRYMRIIRAVDYNDMSRKAADILSAAVIMKPGCVLGLATGSTPLGIYKYLADLYKGGRVDFSQAVAINLDEYRGIAPDAEQSYRYFMNANLFSKINIPLENRHIPNGLAADPAEECKRYDSVIDACGGIDIQLLGIGLNGHIGFNEPQDEFVTDTHVVDLTESTINANSRFFDKPGDVPVQAYTMGIRSIMRARRILLAVSGAEKAEIVKRSFFGGITPHVPASILLLHADVTIIGDEGALSLI